MYIPGVIHDRALGIAVRNGRIGCVKAARDAVHQLFRGGIQLLDDRRKSPRLRRLDDRENFNLRVRGPGARGDFVRSRLTSRRAIHSEKNFHARSPTSQERLLHSLWREWGLAETHA